MRHIDGENLMKNMDNKDEDNLRNIVTYMVLYTQYKWSLHKHFKSRYKNKLNAKQRNVRSYILHTINYWDHKGLPNSIDRMDLLSLSDW